jgi:hypothetical protein
MSPGGCRRRQAEALPVVRLRVVLLAELETSDLDRAADGRPAWQRLGAEMTGRQAEVCRTITGTLPNLASGTMTQGMAIVMRGGDIHRRQAADNSCTRFFESLSIKRRRLRFAKGTR